MYYVITDTDEEAEFPTMDEAHAFAARAAWGIITSDDDPAVYYVTTDTEAHAYAARAAWGMPRRPPTPRPRMIDLTPRCPHCGRELDADTPCDPRPGHADRCGDP